ncbi:MAG: N-acetylmuramoyl-L-alanine amidase [Pseudomonadota bacterium]
MIAFLVLAFGFANLTAITPTARAAQSTANPVKAVAYAGRLIGDANRARLVLDVDRKLSFETRYLSGPYRIIVDFDEVSFNLGKDLAAPDGAVISEIRYGTIAPGRSRIVITSDSPAIVEKASIRQIGSQERYRLIVDLVRTDHDGFKSAMFRLKSRVSTTGEVAFKGDRVRRQKNESAKYTIVVDPGHGGIDGGAEGKTGTKEKEITLSFSKVLKARLEQTGLFDVVLTRDKDVFVALGERIATARRTKASLLISIHADSLNLKRIRGATVYTLSPEGSDELSEELADAVNRSDLIAGLSLPKEDEQVADILIDLTRRETKIFSVQVANLMVQTLRGSVRLIKNPARSANFHVLKSPEVPSILLELGYLSNPEDEKLMKQISWQRMAADSVAKAVTVFFKKRMAQGN